jgi:peptidoglycan/LPS O-acetylase OafA/YrhL
VGLLRLLLALIVVSSHIFPVWIWGVGNILAVKAFFVISGFYMSLVLDQRYAGRSMHFYANRLFRLLPLYLAILGVTVILMIVSPRSVGAPLVNTKAWSSVFSPSSPDFWPLGVGLIATNVTLIGSDWTNWTCYDADTHHLAIEGAHSDVEGLCHDRGIGVYTFLLNGPMWTIGIELTFYLIAPLLAPLHTRTLLVWTVIAALPRVWFLVAGYAVHPWQRGFSPFEMIYFLVGMLAFRWYGWLKPRQLGQRTSWIIAAGAILLTIFGRAEWNWLYVLGLALALPYLFAATNRVRVDEYLGSLSYPVYAIQWLTLGMMNGFVEGSVYAGPHPAAWIALNVAVVLLAAAIAERIVARPLERVRHRWSDAIVAKARSLRLRTPAAMRSTAWADMLRR